MESVLGGAARSLSENVYWKVKNRAKRQWWRRSKERKISPEHFAEIPERQSTIFEELKAGERRGPEFTKWQRNTEVALERIFGTSSRNVTDFKKLRYTGPASL